MPGVEHCKPINTCCFDPCWTGYPGYGAGAGAGAGWGRSFAFILVLFILLAIIGAAFWW